MSKGDIHEESTTTINHRGDIAVKCRRCLGTRRKDRPDAWSDRGTAGFVGAAECPGGEDGTTALEIRPRINRCGGADSAQIRGQGFNRRR